MPPPRKVPRERTPELYALYEGGLSMAAIGKRYGVHEKTVRRRFREAGLPVRVQTPGPMALRARVARGQAVSESMGGYGPEYIAECLSMAAAELGHPPANAEYRGLAAEWGLPSLPRVIQVYGTWNCALRAAGLTPKKPKREYSRRFTYAACLDALRECGREVGRPPTVQQYEEWAQRHRDGGRGRAGRYPSATLIRQRGPGRWVEALAHAFPEEMME